jgi:hypothetical protein
MAALRETLDIDIKKAAAALSKIGEIKSGDDMMLVMLWNGMEVTLYAQGKVMFYPLDSRDLAIAYANEILGAVVE